MTALFDWSVSVYEFVLAEQIANEDFGEKCPAKAMLLHDVHDKRYTVQTRSHASQDCSVWSDWLPLGIFPGTA